MAPEATDGNGSDQNDSTSSSRLLEEIEAAHEKRMVEKRAKIAELKETLSDKELFDVEEFAKLYSLRDLGHTDLISPEIIEELETEYYIKNPNIKSLREFADHKIALDRSGGN
jgi:hypothetical protein